MLGYMILIGWIAGVVIAALGHPKIYRAVFGRKSRSTDKG